MDRGAWWATDHGVTKIWTQVSMHKANAFQIHPCCCKWKIFILFKWVSSVELYIYLCVCVCVCVCVHACSVAHSCLTLCDPLDCSLPGFSVRGIFQARILECVAISSSRDLHISSIGRQILYRWATWEALIFWHRVGMSDLVLDLFGLSF